MRDFLEQGIAGTACKECYETGKKVGHEELEKLGYRVTGRFVVMDDKYKVYEMLRINSSQTAEYSYLTPDYRTNGVIINGAFEKFNAMGNALRNRFTSAKKSSVGNRARSPINGASRNLRG